MRENSKMLPDWLDVLMPNEANGSLDVAQSSAGMLITYSRAAGLMAPEDNRNMMS